MSFQLHFPFVFAVCLTVIIKGVLTLTGQSCPPASLSTFVAAKACNDSSEFHCLFNGRSKLFESYCFKVENFPAGSYVLYQGGLDSKGCSDDRYQPTVYFSNQYNSKCMYSKTRCSDEGQVVHDSSFTEKDGTCRCDYTQGYDFVTKPRNRCFCIPTEEDCSCYKKQCPVNTTLTADEPKGVAMRNIKKDTSSAYSTIKYKSGFQRLFLFSAVAWMVMLLLIGCIVVILSQDKTEELGGENNDFEDDSNTIGETFITRNGFLKSMEALEKYRLVVIKGRYGTGKSYMANQIAQTFPDYKRRLIQKEDFSKFINVTPDGQNQIIIFDEVCNIYEDEEGRSKIIKVIQNVFLSSNLVIITVGEFSNAFIESLRKMALAGDNNLIDLDTEFALSKEEKLSMLKYYLKQTEDKQEDGSSLRDALLTEYVIDAIVSTDTFHGFPLLCATFCSEPNNVRLEQKYFRQPTQQLIDEIKRLRVASSAKKEASNIQYSILIYILLSREGCININGIHNELLREIGGYFCGLGVLEKKIIRYLHMKDIPLQRFLQHIGDEKYTMHPSVYQAVLLSLDNFKFEKVVEKCKLEHVLDLYRMPTYEPLPNEIVLLCKKEEVKIFCKIVPKRMANASLLDEAGVHMVCQYIRKSQNEYLSQPYFSCLENEVRNCLTSKRVHLMLIIYKELVLEARCNDVKENPFLIAWTVLVCNKYEKYSLISDLLKKTFPIAMLGTVVDEHDNIMLTYFTLWWKTDSQHPFVMAVSNLFSQSLGKLSSEHLFKRTKEGVSPLAFAAYFGRHNCLQTFLPQHQRDAERQILSKDAFHKLRNEAEELMELARKGEQKLILDMIKYNTEICPKVEIGTDIDFEKTHNVLQEFRKKLAPP